jgi:hypothetical protein
MRLGKELAEWLIEEGLARTPYNSGNEAVIFVDPTAGAPAPEDLSGPAQTDLTITLETSGGFGTQPYQGFLDRRTITIVYRSAPGKEKELIDLSNAIDAQLDDKRAWLMNNLRIEIAQIYRPLTRIPVSNTDQGSVFEAEYIFLIRKESLAE